jgi:ArsR family transcriptional regulator
MDSLSIDDDRYVAQVIDRCQYPSASMKKKPTPTCCASVLRSRLGRDDADQLATAFKAVADPGRLRLLSFIAGQPDAEACVCNLVEPLGLSQPTVSHHLKVLTDAGLLARERRGTWMFYRLVPERVEDLRQALALPIPNATAKRTA